MIHASAISHNRHSLEAMKLAKGMRRSRQKEKTSQVICHHLRMMLSGDQQDGATRIDSRSGVPHSWAADAGKQCGTLPNSANQPAQIALLLA